MKSLAGVLALLVLAGCATQQEDASLNVDSLRAYREQRIEQRARERLVVTVREPRMRQWNALADDPAAVAAQRELHRQLLDNGRQLGAQAGLRLVDDYPIQMLDLYVYVYETTDADDLERAIRMLERQPQVYDVQRVNIYRTRALPTTTETAPPPDASTANTGDPLAPLQAIPADVLDRLHRVATGMNVLIAVVDTGIDAGHEDLVGANLDVTNLVDDMPAAPESHATAVAGLILAQPYNGAGIRGIAPDARVMVLRACWQEYTAGAAYCNTFTLAKALATALEAGVDIVNLSLTGPMDPLLAALIERLLENNVIVVAAYHDQADQGVFPAALPGVVAVTARPTLASYPSPVYAPGENVLTLLPNDRYGLQDGSSISAAQVSGIASLFRQHLPAMSGTELNELLHGRNVEQEGLAGLIEALQAAASR